MENSIQDLLHEITVFVRRYSWIHDFPIIKIFSLGTFGKIPKEWVDYLKLLDDDFSLACDRNNLQPLSLSQFLEDCTKFSLSNIINENKFNAIPYDLQFRKVNNCVKSDDFALSLGTKTLVHMNPKKQHEVRLLSSFVIEVMKTTNCRRVIDIGSGLGYVDIVLHKMNNFKILGIESSLEKVNSAYKLQKNYLESSCPNLNYKELKLYDNHKSLIAASNIINEFSIEKFQCNCRNTVTEAVTNDTVSMVSLHACADLSPIMLKIFTENKLVSSIINIPCCYHKLHPNEPVSVEEGETAVCFLNKFDNFPMSNHLVGIFEKEEFSINVGTLRLASDETIAMVKKRNSERKDNMCIAYRAILQYVCDKDNISMTKLKRRPVHKSEFTSFQSYIEIILESYSFANRINNKDIDDKSKLLQLCCQTYLKFESQIPLIGMLRSLQLHIQPVLEALVLIDRLIYLRERGFNMSGLDELMSDSCSPRRFALYALRRDSW